MKVNICCNPSTTKEGKIVPCTCKFLNRKWGRDLKLWSMHMKKLRKK